MQINFDTTIAQSYKNNSQRARVLTEQWVQSEIYCPNCGNDISPYENNRPVADFYCKKCKEEYELKSKKNNMGKKIVDGAYKTMIERLQSQNNPNFFFLNYSLDDYKIVNFAVIPKHFFVADFIERRKALSDNARRAGWVGCNILLHDIPRSGKIFYVKGGHIESKENVLNHWQKTLFLRDAKKPALKGWILDVMSCIERINKSEFNLQEVYGFEGILRAKHSDNKHVKDKIRQQLQFLRDKGYVEFLGRGKYRLT